jgi:8-oxo-dGTP pyrophosphatase MutT (NUDIX family)
MTEPEAAVAIVHARQPVESVLLIRRTERPQDHWSGHWSLPGGRSCPADPDLAHTALRELAEECGILLPREHLQAALPHVVARRRVKPYVLVAPFVFATEQPLPTRLQADEAVEARWVPLSLLRDPASHALRSVPGQPREFLYPSIDLGATPLWGFTYRVLTDWLDLAPRSSSTVAAGFEAARRVLDNLAAFGAAARQAWSDGDPSRTPVKTVQVRGPIPVDDLLARFSAPSHFLPGVNCLEVRADRIRIVGLAFEEYWICTTP